MKESNETKDYSKKGPESEHSSQEGKKMSKKDLKINVHCP